MFSITSISALAATLLASASAQVSTTTVHPVPIMLNMLADDVLQNLYVDGVAMPFEESLPNVNTTWVENMTYQLQATRGKTYSIGIGFTNTSVGSPAAVFFDAIWNGNSIAHTGNVAMKCMQNPPTNWQLPGFNDSAWTTAALGTAEGSFPSFFTNKQPANAATGIPAGSNSGFYGCRFSVTVPATETSPVAVSDCGVTAGKGSAKTISTGNPKCLCHSEFGGSNCHLTAHARCNDNAAALSVDNSEAEITFADIYGQDLVITTKFEMVNNKKYNSVRIGTCDFSRFTLLESQVDHGVCQDYQTVGVPVASLKNLCNFTVTSDVIIDGKKHMRFRGHIFQDYQEPVTYASVDGTPGNAAAIADVRDVTIALPIDVLLLTQFTLPEIKDVKSYSKFDIKAAVTGQYVNPYGGSSIVTITYATHFPYTVTSFNPVVAMTGTKGLVSGNVNVVTPVSAGVHLRDYDDYDNTQWVIKERTRFNFPGTGSVVGSSAGVTSAAACQTAAAAAGKDAFVFNLATNACSHWKHSENLAATPALVELADQTGFTSGILSQLGTYVVREINLTYTHNACELDGTYTIQNMVVNCATGLPQVDCPLYAPETGNSIQFVLDSENFCDGQGFSAVISDALEITEFIAVPKNAITTATEQQNAWIWNEPAYFRATFAGLAIDRVDMMSLTTSAGNHLINFKTVAGSVVDHTTNVAGVGQMGLIVATQRYYFAHPMSVTFAGAEPTEGVGAPLVVRCTVNVGYAATAGLRRRRAVALRQETEEEAGVAVVESQGSVIAPTRSATTTAAPQQEGVAVDDSSASIIAASAAALVAVMAF